MSSEVERLCRRWERHADDWPAARHSAQFMAEELRAAIEADRLRELSERTDGACDRKHHEFRSRGE